MTSLYRRVRCVLSGLIFLTRRTQVNTHRNRPLRLIRAIRVTSQKNQKKSKIFDFHDLAVYLHRKKADKHSSPGLSLSFTRRFHSTKIQTFLQISRLVTAASN